MFSDPSGLASERETDNSRGISSYCDKCGYAIYGDEIGSPIEIGTHQCGGGDASSGSVETHVAEFNLSFGSDLSNTKETLGAETPGIGEKFTGMSGSDHRGSGSIEGNGSGARTGGDGNPRMNNPSDNAVKEFNALIKRLPEFAGGIKIDGKLTFEIAKAWYQFAHGALMIIDLNTIDLSRVNMSDFNSMGLATVRLAGEHFSNLDDALVHGTITLQRIGNTNQAKLALNSDSNTPELNGQPAAKYDFEMHSWFKIKNRIRNPETFIGGLINGLMPMQGIPGGFGYLGGLASQFVIKALLR